MNFNNSFILNTFSQDANKQFEDLSNRLTAIDNSFQTKMDGKTTGGLVGSLIGTLIWLAAFASCAIFLRDMIDKRMLIVALGIIGCLFVFMIIDSIMDFSYYGKITSYKNSISQLNNRVVMGKNSIMSNHDAFLEARSRGWNFILKPATSIPDEATSVEATLTNLESMKKGFIHGVKNVFFYISVVSITVVGGIALFPVGQSIMEIGGASLSADTVMALNAVGLFLSGLGTILLAKLIWSKTDCSVNNVTLFSTILGPIAFLALIAIGTLIVYLAIGMFYILLIVAGVAVVGACVCGG